MTLVALARGRAQPSSSSSITLCFKFASIPPPPVVDAHATDMLDNAYGAGAPGNPETRAGRAAKRARTAFSMADTGNITTPELGQQVAFAVEESLAVVGAGAGLPAGAPAWAVAMNTNMNNQFAGINNQFAGINNQFAVINNRLSNIEARQMNAVATENDDPIFPVTVPGVAVPADFPNTYGELIALTSAQSSLLLTHYGRPTVPVATRNLRLRKFLGTK